MRIRDAISKAVAGGYPDDFGFGTPRVNEYKHGEIEGSIQGYVLDKDFWQALGKSLGWENNDKLNPYPTYWENSWHHLIDHLAQGGTVEEYFAGLN